MYRIRRIALGASLLAATILLACSKDSTGPSITDPGNGTAVNLKGTLAGITLSGDIDITISAAASPLVTGCIYLKSATCVSASGTYTTASKALSFSTTTPALTFTGTYAGGVVDGTFSGAGGSGKFAVINGTVTTFCGTFAGAASGRWNFSINGGSLNGQYNDGTSNYDLSGSVSGTTLSMTFSAGTATGTLSGTSASGSWTAGAATGTWTGSNTGCRS
jgi:hypothetical protein